MANVELVKAIKVGNVVTSLGELADGDSVTLKGDTGVGGKITFNNAANDNGTTLTIADNATTSVTFTLPSADGTIGQVLSTNGSGVLAFSDDSGISLTTARGGLSVATGSASGGGTLTYTSGTGVFDFAPADLSSYSTQSYATGKAVAFSIVFGG